MLFHLNPAQKRCCFHPHVYSFPERINLHIDEILNNMKTGFIKIFIFYVLGHVFRTDHSVSSKTPYSFFKMNKMLFVYSDMIIKSITCFISVVLHKSNNSTLSQCHQYWTECCDYRSVHMFVFYKSRQLQKNCLDL